MTEKTANWQQFSFGAAVARRADMELSVLTEADARYPLQLQHHDGPRALYCRGNLHLLARPLVAIVGSRDVEPEAEVFTERLAAAVGRMGIAIVSGGARGVDSAAHRGAQLAGAPTVVVLGLAHDAVPSRPTERVLSALDLSRDLIVSEQAPGTRPHPHHFLQRNRIIARMAHAVVVVRARAMSGALSTAGFARAAKRLLFAVPGAPWDERSTGVNALLTQGASIVRGVSDLTQVLQQKLQLPAACVPAPFGDPRLEFLQQPRSVDELMLRWRLSAEQVLRTLVQYELGGCVRKLMDGRFVAARMM